jgi:hypothetical protein
MKAFSVFKIAGWIVVGLGAAVLFGLGLGLVVQGLWNWLMPALFGLHTISYWQAVGLFVLCHLLFKGHHPGHHGAREQKKGSFGKFAHRVHASMGGACEAPETPSQSGPVA